MGEEAEPTGGATVEAKPPAPPAPEVAEDWSTRYKYLLADFENYRKRTDRERESTQLRVRAALLRELIPIYETFERAREIAASPSGTPDGLRTGLDLLGKEWRRFLKEEGVEPVAEVGEPFAPEEEEAVAEVAAGGELHEGSVAEIVQQGYRFEGGLLRPAKVVVARSTVPPIEGEAGSEPSVSEDKG